MKAEKLQDLYSFSSKDALHIACALYVKAKYFITCDDDILRKSALIKDSLEIFDPIEFIKKEILK